MIFKMFGLNWKPILRMIWVANGAAFFFLFFHFAFEGDAAGAFIFFVFGLLWVCVSSVFKAKGVFESKN